MTTITKTTDPANEGYVHVPETDPATDIYAESEARLAGARKAALDAKNAALDANADNAHRSLILRVQQGDTAITAHDLAAAREEEALAKARSVAATDTLHRVERTGGPWRPDVALLLAKTVGESLAVAVAVVDRFGPSGEALTAALRQGTPTVRDPSEGTLSAEVQVRSYRTARHVPSDWKDLEAALKKAGIRATVHSRPGGQANGVVWDSAVIDVKAAVPSGSLVLRAAKDTPDISGTARYTTFVAVESARALGVTAVRVTDPKGHRVVRDGKVTSVVEFRLQVGTHELLREAAEALKGQTHPGLGTVDKVELSTLPDARVYGDGPTREERQVGVTVTYSAVTA